MTPLRMIKAAWQRWTVIAHKIGNVQSRILLSVVYFVVVGPFAVVARLVSDPLRLARAAAPVWLGRAPAAGDPAVSARRQF
jgi:hypothetical protein